jgi:toxin ParE1/3/4
VAYKLTHSAEQDLIDIYVEGFRLFGERQAEAYAQTFRQTFELLAAFPRLARERVELTPPVRIHPCGSHIIVYLVMETGRRADRAHPARPRGLDQRSDRWRVRSFRLLARGDLAAQR